MEQAALQAALPDIEGRGATLVTLSPQLADFARAWVNEDGIEIDVLLDLGLGVARDYGLAHRVDGALRELYLESFKIDLSRFNGDESWALPLPATFVIDRDGTIVFASADPDYTVRPEPEHVVAAIPADA